MEELGRLLKERREQVGLSLEDIQHNTKIRGRYLEAIENGNLHELPGGVYARGFVRSYAEQVGLDGQQLIDQFGVGASDAEFDVREVAEARQPTPPLYFKREKKGRASAASFDWTSGGRQLVWGIGILALVIVGYLLLGNLGGGHSTAKNPLTTDPPKDSESARTPSGSTTSPDAASGKSGGGQSTAGPAGSSAAESTTPTVTFASKTATSAVVFVSKVSSLNLDIKVSNAPCWISITSDGVTSQETLQPGDAKTYSASRELKLRIGHPPSVSGILNGQPFSFEKVNQPFDYDIKVTS